MTIKKNLLEIVQEILSDMDSEEVNSLDDSIEAKQVASIVESTFYNIVATREVPEHRELLSLNAASDSETPTHFSYPTNTRRLESVKYNIGTDEAPNYREVKYLPADEFLDRVDCVSANYQVVLVNDTRLKIRLDKQPEYYTSFDDEIIVMDSWDIEVDSTLQETKTRALGYIIPTFQTTDDYVPDLAPAYFPYLINESKSVSFDVLKGGTTAKIDQAARRQKSYIQNDRYKTKQYPGWNDYGRH